MQLSELRTFLAIVETGSLVKASTKLNVTQSTVTARLKSLEAELGQVLINRQKSGASLTAAGVRLKRYADTITDLWRQARQETALPDAMSSVCNIGCHPDLWSNLGDRFFGFIQENLPQVALSVWQGNDATLTGWLNDGLVDIAFTYQPNSSQHQNVTELGVDRLILVSTLQGSPIKFDPNYVFVEAGEEFGREHAAAYADAVAARISFGTAQLGLDHLLQNGGSAYLPERMVQEHVKSEALFKLEDAPVFTRKTYMIANQNAVDAWPWIKDALKYAKLMF